MTYKITRKIVTYEVQIINAGTPEEARQIADERAKGEGETTSFSVYDAERGDWTRVDGGKAN